MKVCHFAATKGIGRGEVFVEIANEMSKRIQTHLLFPNDALFRKNISSRVHSCGYKVLGSRNNLFLLFELYFFFKRSSFDLVHTHFGKATQVFKLLNRLLKIPHLATKHNPRPSTAFNGLKHISVVSQGALESVTNHDASVRVIRNGISVKSQIEIPIKEPGQIFQILVIGRLDPIKGFDLLIEQLSNLRFEFLLTIAGDGSERKYLESLANEKLGSDKFKFLGFRHDVENLIRTSDLVISSSLSEGCPLVLIESLFFAKIFISTPVGEAADLLPVRFLTDTHDIASKVIEIRRNYLFFCEEFRNFANQVKDHYSAISMVDQYLDAYDYVSSGMPFKRL